MVKRKGKSVTDVLIEKFKQSSSNGTDSLTDITMLYAPRPDINKLIYQYYRNFTNRVVRKMQKEDGSRRVYADKQTDAYVDIENETDIEKLKRIRKKLHRQSKGNNSACKTVTARLAELCGQTVLEFEQVNSL